MPHFEFAQAEKVATALDPNNGRYNAVTDSFITINADGDEESWPGEVIALPDGHSEKVYPIGAGAWIWDEDEKGGPSWV